MLFRLDTAAMKALRPACFGFCMCVLSLLLADGYPDVMQIAHVMVRIAGALVLLCIALVLAPVAAGIARKGVRGPWTLIDCLCVLFVTLLMLIGALAYLAP